MRDDVPARGAPPRPGVPATSPWPARCRSWDWPRAARPSRWSSTGASGWTGGSSGTRRPGRARKRGPGHRRGQRRAAARRTIALDKPRGVVTTRHDPEGRPTVYELIAGAGDGLAPAGRLDIARTGLLVCTNDTQLAAWLDRSRSSVEREYVVTVRGRMSRPSTACFVDGARLAARHIGPPRPRSARHRIEKPTCSITLTEGRNREIRRLCESVGHEVTRVHRIRIGGLVARRSGPRPRGGISPRKW